MKLIFVLCLCVALPYKSWTQGLSTTPIGHSHNDYKRTCPFSTASDTRMGSIEVDVFLIKDELYVAHTRWQIDKQRTLDKLYLRRIAEDVRQCKAYKMQLVLDVKNRSEATLNKIIEQLQQYPDVFNDNSPITVIISGKRPAPEAWDNFPNYIYFDGRANEQYSEAQQKRVGMMSANLRHYKHCWKKFKGTPQENSSPLQNFIDLCHAKGKKIRLWNVPDNNKAWKKLVALGVDFINTNKPLKLYSFFKKNNAPLSNHD